MRARTSSASTSKPVANSIERTRIVRRPNLTAIAAKGKSEVPRTLNEVHIVPSAARLSSKVAKTFFSVFHHAAPNCATSPRAPRALSPSAR